MIYDEAELQRSIEAGERRLAAIKQTARRRKRWQSALVVVVVLGAALGTATFIASKRVPSAPHFVVTWPKSKTQQSVASGQTILAREGQPFDISVSEASKWSVTWNAGGVEQNGESFSWPPQKTGELLLARCKAKNTDWTAYFSSVVPTRDLSLGAVIPELDEQYRMSVSLPSGSAWVFAHVQAVGNVSWDERALPILSTATSAVPEAALAQKLEAINESPAPALWQIVSDFDGQVQSPATDGATYASLHADNLEVIMPQMGARLVELAPEASIKWVLRLDKDSPEAIVRMVFDNKAERRAWVKRKGDNAGTPIRGWESGQWNGTIPPELPAPTAAPPSTQ
ncbi:hypothetical protein IAD21_03049 [Abditibacteriota bacterium]|nr:hypothetical protein IAD21_03049 [Abditibacteriota bacterium]